MKCCIKFYIENFFLTKRNSDSRHILDEEKREFSYSLSAWMLNPNACLGAMYKKARGIQRDGGDRA